MDEVSDATVVTRDGLQRLIELLVGRGYRVIGPTLRDGAIAYDRIDSIDDFPVGWTDEQDGGHYRLRRRDDEALFGYAVGPHSWKRYLHPPRLRLWQAQRGDEGMRITAEADEPPRYAFIGVRACELNAIAIQDKVFLGGPYVDPYYQRRRDGIFTVAVNCAVAGGTCFCASMGTGPRVGPGFDLALTEIIDESGHRFLLECGTAVGEEVLADLPHRAAKPSETESARAIVERTAQSMGREMPAVDVPALLRRNLEHPRWDDVADRCLTCGNCTMVCPTCFCTSVDDETDLSGEAATRTRRWDSCFTMDFSYVHGGSVRSSARSRYRQWMTHKLATWVDQFGTSGCVGCGRCITWCPVGIDITEEVRAIRDKDGGGDGP